MTYTANINKRLVKAAPFAINNISDIFEDFTKDKNYQLKVYLKRNLVDKSNYLDLSIKYIDEINNNIIKFLCKHRINNLPISFNNYILDYIIEKNSGWTKAVWSGYRWVPTPCCILYKNIDIRINYPRDYPFSPPIYSLSNSNICKQSHITEYNNCWRNFNNWSPIYDIKREIFVFIVFLKDKELF